MLAFFRKYPGVYVLLFLMTFSVSFILLLGAFHLGKFVLAAILFVITLMIQGGGLKFYQYKIYNYRMEQDKSPD